MRSTLLALGCLALIGVPAQASPLTATSSNQGVNNQTNSGTVVQNPSGGSQANINQNNAYSSTYSFGPGISCPTPSLAFSTFGAGGQASGGGYSTDSGTYGASVSFIIPFGGDVGESCRKLVTEIAHQRLLDTQVNIIKVCAELANQGVKLDPELFPEFQVCSGVTVAGNHAIKVQPTRIFSESDRAVPVVPVR